VPLDVTRVLGRRAEEMPEVHVTAAAEEMLTGVVAGEESAPLVLGWIGARVGVTQAETGGREPLLDTYGHPSIGFRVMQVGALN
jgi:hypothetical protein